MTLSSLFQKAWYLFYLAFVGRFSHKPYHCQFQITRRCNFKCVYCCVWRVKSGKELSVYEVGRLARNLRLSGVKSVVITGGEPLLRQDIIEVVSMFKSERLIVRLQTNGLLLDRNMAERLFDAGLDDIYISLDTMNRDRFRSLSGISDEDAYDRLISNIKTTSEIAKRYGAGRFILTVMMPENSGELEDLVNFADETGYLIGIYGVETSLNREVGEIRASTEELNIEERDRKKLAEAFERAIKLKKKKGSSIFNSQKLLRDYRDFFSSSEPDMRWKCRAGRHYFLVLPDGRLSVCNSVKTIEGYNYINLPELYARPDREDIFKEYRKKCSGCICTRQLEYLITDWKDIFRKTFQYLRNVYL